EAVGCTFPKNVEQHARERGRPLLEALARLHAHFWEDERFAHELSWITPAMRGAFGAKLVEIGRERYGPEPPAVVAAVWRSPHARTLCGGACASPRPPARPPPPPPRPSAIAGSRSRSECARCAARRRRAPIWRRSRRSAKRSSRGDPMRIGVMIGPEKGRYREK